MKFVFDSHEEIRDYAAHTLHMVNGNDPIKQPAYIDNSGLRPVDVRLIHGQEPAAEPQLVPQVDYMQPVQQPPVTAPPMTAPQIQQPVQVPPVQQQAAPMTPPPVQQPMPTTPVAQAYSQDQISVAMAGLVSQGKQQEVMALVQSFGANSLLDLPQDQYGALVVKLKEMGAKL